MNLGQANLVGQGVLYYLLLHFLAHDPARALLGNVLDLVGNPFRRTIACQFFPCLWIDAIRSVPVQ